MHSVIRRNEDMDFRSGCHWAPRRSDSGIDNDDMYAAGRKAAVAAFDNECRLENVVRSDFVCYIDNLRFRGDTQYHALHNSCERVGKAEVRRERYNGWHATRLSR